MSETQLENSSPKKKASRKSSNVVRLTQYQVFSGGSDFTVERLRAMIEKSSNRLRTLKLVALLSDYKKGLCSVTWRDGEPFFVKTTKKVFADP